MTAPRNRSMPPGAIIPVLGFADVTAGAAWLCQAFGFQERLRIGAHRVQLVFGGGSVVVAELRGSAPGMDSIMVHVPDVDAHCARAARHGAHILNPPADQPYGERQYTAEDPAGRRWTFSQSIADVDPADWGGQLFETIPGAA
ncbi:MAG: VOC family protein [Anaerolineales bacterium]